MDHSDFRISRRQNKFRDTDSPEGVGVMLFVT